MDNLEDITEVNRLLKYLFIISITASNILGLTVCLPIGIVYLADPLCEKQNTTSFYGISIAHSILYNVLTAIFVIGYCYIHKNLHNWKLLKKFKIGVISYISLLYIFVFSIAVSITNFDSSCETFIGLFMVSIFGGIVGIVAIILSSIILSLAWKLVSVKKVVKDYEEL